MLHTILVVDDDRAMRSALRHLLLEHHYNAIEVSSGAEALRHCRENKPSAVLLDMVMPDMDGLATLRMLKEQCSDLPVIIVTGHGDVPSAVSAIKLGAYDYVIKPPDIDRLLVLLQHAMEKSELEREVRRLHTAAESSLEWLLGRSSCMRHIIQQIQQVSRTDFTVVLEGETGVGKSFIAGLIHSISGRANRSFVRVDMAAIPETLVETELFGHERGAFTGAVATKKGFFEQANGGTLFIDELENMSTFVQTKFLSVLEDRKIRHLGGSELVNLDLRVITATNRNIKEALKENKFRKDLYYRVSEFVITVPPLRERTEDIPFLSQKFLTEACADLQRPGLSLAEDTYVFLMQYPWPGNVRELRNVIRRAVLIADDGGITPDHVQYLVDDVVPSGNAGEVSMLMPLKEVSALAVRDVEKKAVQRALAAAKGNKTRAASILQIDFKTLQTKIREYGVQ